MRVRKDVRAELHYRMSIQIARINACQVELDRIKNMQERAYRVTWMQMLDHYQEFLILQFNARGCNLFWVLTGYRWLPLEFLRHCLTKLQRRL